MAPVAQLSEEELDGIYDALIDPANSYAVAKLLAKVPKERLRFTMKTLEESGLLDIKMHEGEILIHAPYSMERAPLVVRRRSTR
jgi:hypothetical protein